HGASMSAEHPCFGGRIFAREVPETGLVRACHKPATVRADFYARDRPRMTEKARFSARIRGSQVPDPSRMVIAARHKPAAVRADRQAGNAICVASQQTRVGTRIVGRQVPDASRCVVAPRDQPATVMADSDAVDLLLMTRENARVGVWISEVPDEHRL